MAGSYGGYGGIVGNYAVQTSTSATTYAGYGSFGSTGTATFTWNTSPHWDSMRYTTSLRVEIPRQRIYIMPDTRVWSAWTDNTDTWDASTYTNTVEFQQRVWGQWVDHERESQQHAVYQLNEEGLRQVALENERRQREYARQQAVFQEEYQKREKAQKSAEAIAQVLLGELIGEDQLAVYKETGRVLVKGRKHDYLVWKTGKVQRIEKDKLVDLCVHVSRKILLPDTDNVIGLAMQIKADEKDFNKIANVIGRAAPLTPLPLAANF